MKNEINEKVNVTAHDQRLHPGSQSDTTSLLSQKQRKLSNQKLRSLYSEFVCLHFSRSAPLNSAELPVSSTCLHSTSFISNLVCFQVSSAATMRIFLWWSVSLRTADMMVPTRRRRLLPLWVHVDRSGCSDSRAGVVSAPALIYSAWRKNPLMIYKKYCQCCLWLSFHMFTPHRETDRTTQTQTRPDQQLHRPTCEQGGLSFIHFKLLWRRWFPQEVWRGSAPQTAVPCGAARCSSGSESWTLLYRFSSLCFLFCHLMCCGSSSFHHRKSSWI